MLSIVYVIMLLISFVGEIVITTNNTIQPQSVVEETSQKEYPGVYYASAEEETGASESPKDSKGAIYVGDGSTFAMNSGTISGHTTTYGGAVYVASGGVFTMTGGSIEDNEAEYGGAIYVESGGTCNLYSGLIKGNISDQGSSVYVESGAVVNIGNPDYVELPDEYQQVEYVYTGSAGSLISFGIEWKDIALINASLRKSSTNVNIMIYNSGLGQTSPYIAYNRTNLVSATFTPSASTMLDLQMHNFNITISSESSNIISTSSWDGIWWERIDYGIQKFYAKDNELIGNFIPCYRKSDDVTGFYDKVSGQFVTRYGSNPYGAVIYRGNDIKPMKIIESWKKWYQEVEYIESTGTQWIDTNYIPSLSVKYVAHFEIDTYVTNIWFMGTYELGLCKNDDQIYVAYNGTSHAFYSTLGTGKKFKAELTKNAILIDNDKYEFSISSLINSTKSATLFKTTYFPDTLYGKLYDCKIYDNGVLVRDFVPCYRKSDNEIGLYDTVNDEFYSNQGKETFLKGPDV